MDHEYAFLSHAGFDEDYQLLAELRHMECSGDVGKHVHNFIHGLFGKGGMMLPGGGTAWKFEFAPEDNFPPMLKLEHSNGSELVAVAGLGEIIKEEYTITIQIL